MLHSTYGKGIPYEAFMGRAFKCMERDTRKGTCGSIYELLIQLEDGTALYRKVSYAAQLEKLKKWLEKAINAFLKRKLDPAEQVLLRQLLFFLRSAQTSSDLELIIEKGLDVTQRFKIY